MSLPIDDWQFWAVSVVALGAVWLLLRPILASKSSDGCDTCAPRRPERTSLTVEGEDVRRK